MKYVFMGLVTLIFLIVISLGLDYGLGVKWYSFIALQKENVRRQVFENTNSFVRGKNQDLLRYYQQYQKANEEDKVALQELIRLDFANFPEENIQSGKLRSFLEEMKY